MSTEQETEVRKIEDSKFKAQIVEIENLGRELNVADINRPSGLEKPQFVVSFWSKTEKCWVDLIVEPLSPGQFAILNNTPFAKSAAASRDKLEKVLEKETFTADEAKAFTEDEENKPMLDEFENYKLEVAIMATVAPKNITKEWFLAQDSEVVEDVYEAAMNGVTSVDDVDVFPEEDDGTGDEGRPDNTGGSLQGV